jgi:Protein of unknown function (DUF1572)
MFEDNYIDSVKKQFSQYKSLGEKAMNQVPEEGLNWQFNPETNSITINVKHMAGNMVSRFTDFYNSDGEKPSRNRDGEFENETLTREKLMTRWHEGWDCLFVVLNGLSPEDLSRIVLIRNEPFSVMEAINRQLTHYAYHVGQIVHISKMITDSHWKTLTVPRKGSREFNAKMGL